MSTRTFADIVHYLAGIKKKLDVVPNTNHVTDTLILLDSLNMLNQLKKFRFVHIAGTKGKGTTAAYTSAILQAHGLKVGLFSSPHIVDIRERLMIQNKFLPKELFAQYFFEMKDRFEELADSESMLVRNSAKKTGFFRFMFLLSLHVFLKESVDVAVIEVGLGGRLDTTNVITPDVSVITSLGLDHTDILGDTLSAVALEKAGIMKPGVICYTAPQSDHPETLDVLIKHGREVGAPVVVVDSATLPIRNWPRLAIGGSHAVENSKLGLLAARRVAGLSPTLPLLEAERGVLQTMTLAGRSHVVPLGSGRGGTTFYLDGAHTPESLLAATRWFLTESADITGEENPRRVLIFYCSRNPNVVLNVFAPFLKFFSKVILAFVLNPSLKRDVSMHSDYDVAAARLMAMKKCWESLYPDFPCFLCEAPFNTLEEVLDATLPIEGDQKNAIKPAQIFVTGSFFLLRDIMTLTNAN